MANVQTASPLPTIGAQLTETNDKTIIRIALPAKRRPSSRSSSRQSTAAPVTAATWYSVRRDSAQHRGRSASRQNSAPGTSAESGKYFRVLAITQVLMTVMLAAIITTWNNTYHGTPGARLYSAAKARVKTGDR